MVYMDLLWTCYGLAMDLLCINLIIFEWDSLFKYVLLRDKWK
jgi:hypothetical protein